MKKLKLVCLILFSCLLVNNLYSQDDDPVNWKFFKIDVTTSDDSLFIKVQNDMGISPYLDRYTIYIDVRNENPKEHFLVLGDINHESSMKFTWSQFSEFVKNGLLNWTGKNKIKIE